MQTKINIVALAIALLLRLEPVAAQTQCISCASPMLPPNIAADCARLAASGVVNLPAGTNIPARLITAPELRQITAPPPPTGGAILGESGDGNCPNNLIGGPLLSNAQAAVGLIQQSSTVDGENRVANNTVPTLDELATFHSRARAWAQRVDGQCPTGLTTPEILQWAANKWGIDPRLAWAEAAEESHWEQRAVGDKGGSHGLYQVNDRPAARPGGEGHYDPALYDPQTGYASMLAQESSCFNADFWAGRVYAAFHGSTGGVTPAGDMNAAVQSWFDGNYTYQNGGSYSGKVCSVLAAGGWQGLLS